MGLGSRCDSGHVRCGLRRQGAFPRGFTRRPEERLMAAGGKVEPAGRFGLHVEGVDRACRDVDRCSWADNGRRSACEKESQLPLKDGEGFLRVGLAVQWRGHAGRAVLLDQAEVAIGLFGGGFEEDQRAKESEFLALAVR